MIWEMYFSLGGRKLVSPLRSHFYCSQTIQISLLQGGEAQWQRHDTEPAKGTRIRSLSNTLPLGGTAKLHQIQCLSAHSPPHIKYHPGLYQEETGLNVWFNKPAAKLIISIFTYFCHL